MSLIKANAVQIGQSGTATQNFTLAVPSSPDGTIKLARGNSGATTQDVLNVSNTGVVSFPQGLGNISNSTAIATGSNTARSLANRFADVVNVKDFGAVSDYYLPNGSVNPTPTDNAIAFQNAVNYAATLLTPSTEINYPVVNGAVYIPSGAYYIASGSSITLKKGVCIFGESRSSSQIIHGGGNVPCIATVDYTSDPNNTNVQIQIEKLFILGSGSSTTYGIKIYDSYRNSDVKEVTVKNCNVGLYANDSYTLFVDRCDFQFAITDSIQIYNPTAISVFNTRIDNSGRHGIYLDGTTNNQGVHAVINNCQIQRSQKSGIQSIDVASLNVKDCYFEGNNRDSSSSSDIDYLNGSGNRCVNCIIDGVFATCATGGTNNRFITSDSTLTLVGSRNFDSVSDPAIYTYGVYLNSGVDKFVSINNILVATTAKIFRASTTTNIYEDSNVNCYIPNSKFGLRETGGGIEVKLTAATNQESSIVFGDISDEAQAGLYYTPSTQTFSFNGYNNSQRIKIKEDGQLNFVPRSTPASGVSEGDVYYDLSAKKLKVYNGTTWQTITSA